MATRPAVRVFGVATFISALAASIVGVTLAQSGGGPGSGGTLTTTFRPGTVVRPGQLLEFTVQSTHPQRDSVSLIMLNPPPGCVFTQVHAGAPPAKGSPGSGLVTAKGTVRWLVPGNVAGFRRLSFRATDHTHPSNTLFASVELRVDRPGSSLNTGIQIGDVTGDGVLDTVGGASFADAAGVADSGAIYVWYGSTAPSGAPEATLLAPAAVVGDRLGSLGNWVPYYGIAKSQGIQLADVTGDGVLDVVVGAYAKCVAGVQYAGAIYVWRGGPTLSGAPAPLATLTVPGAIVGDQLGYGSGQTIELADVTGDGVLDLVASAIYADVGGVSDVGAVYVWKGGTTLNGSLAPLATLVVPGAVAGDSLGYIGPPKPWPYYNIYGQGIRIADVTGDGLLDVIAGASFADVAGVWDTGAIYVWKGGPTLSGSPAPLATLSAPGAVWLGATLGGDDQGIKLADVSGDGVLDVVAGSYLANVAGVVAAGAVYMWTGGATLAGSLPPFATLTVSGAVAYDELGSGSPGFQFADVSGDGVLDVVANTPAADVAGVVGAGAVYVWMGGPTLNGMPALLATLTVTGAAAWDVLGSVYGQGVLVADVSGDGFLDVIAGTSYADIAGKRDVGAIYVWSGGATLSGSPAPLATLTISGAFADDLLGLISPGGPGIQLADVTADGVLDVVAGAMYADLSTKQNVGAIYVWNGGATLSGSPASSATLSISGAYADDKLGSAGIYFADVTADGVLDVVASTPDADMGGTRNRGAMYVWQGGSTLTGSPSPLATLKVSGSASLGRQTQVADVSADRTLDLVISSDEAGGAIHVWSGGSTLSGTPAQLAALTVPGANWSDGLGAAGGQGIHLADVTGDGLLDVVAGAQKADIAGVVDTGAIYQWLGGSTLVGTPPLLQTMTVPGALPSDWLGL